MGGGIYCIDAVPTIEGCAIRANTAVIGGGIGCHYSLGTIINCKIAENAATYGGGISFYGSSSSTNASIDLAIAYLNIRKTPFHASFRYPTTSSHFSAKRACACHRMFAGWPNEFGPAVLWCLQSKRLFQPQRREGRKGILNP
jgi:hypothetical protein